MPLQEARNGILSVPACRAEAIRGDLIVLFVDGRHIIVQLTESLNLDDLPLLGSSPFSKPIWACFVNDRVVAVLNSDKSHRAECYHYTS